MAIAIGLVIDDAVVVTENIVRHLHLHAGSRPAIREAVQELIWPVTTSTITTVVVFLPLGLLTGVDGQFFQRALGHADDRGAGVAGAGADASSRCSARSSSPRPMPTPSRRAARGLLARTRPCASIACRIATSGRCARCCTIRGWRSWSAAGAGRRRASWPTASSARASCRRWTKARSCSTTGRPAARRWPRPTGAARRRAHPGEHPEVDGTSRRTGAELGLFATQQNRGDIVVRLKPRRPAHRVASTRSSTTSRTRIESAAPAAAHRVRPDPLRRHRRPGRATRARSRSSCSAPTSTRSRRTRSGSAGGWRRSTGSRTCTTASANRAPSWRCASTPPRRNRAGLTPRR